MDNNEYVLTIPSWFPSEVNLFNGDFNERMVSAFSDKYFNVVIYVVPSIDIKKTKILEIDKKSYKIIYGYYNKSTIRFFAKPINIIKYIFLNCKLINNLIIKNGKPIFLHTYVFYPAGFLSWFFAKKMSLKHILTENYTVFYNTMPNNLHNDFFITKFLKKKLLRSFDLLLPVANALKTQMLKFAPHSNYAIIPNVVDDSQFRLTKISKPFNVFKFIHISTMGFQKNPQLLLKAFEKFLTNGNKSNLVLVGPINDNVVHIINKSEILINNVSILGEKSHQQIADILSNSDCLVLSSRFENLPCVILEALCCGVPVISTDVGGVNEVIDDSNGLIIQSENEQELINAYEEMATNFNKYNRKEISEIAIEKFSYKNVSKNFYDILRDNHIINP